MKLTSEELHILHDGLSVLKEAWKHIADENVDQDLIDKFDSFIVKYEDIIEGGK